MDYVRQLVTTSNRDANNWTAPLQQDSAEFLGSLLEACEAECRDVEPTIQGFFESNIGQHFCCSRGCQSEKHKVESHPFCLPIPAENSNSVEQSLGMLFRTEDGVLLNCENCPCKVARKSTRMEKFPTILILQLTRFQGGEAGERKIARNIRVPEVLLPDREGPSYTLASGIVHSGSASAGHYICIAKCPTSGRFFTVDDHRPVTEYDARKRTLEQSYLVVYQKMPEHGTPVRKKLCVAGDIVADKDSAGMSARFEELTSGLTSRELNQILEKYGIRRQNAVKRRIDDLRRHFRKHPDQQTDILTDMSKRDTNVMNDIPSSRGDGLPTEACLPVPPSVHSSLQEEQASESRNECVTLELPSPTYVPLDNTDTADQQTSDRHQVVNIDSLIAGVDGLMLSNILKELNIKPQNAVTRRRAQIKKFSTMSESNQAAVIQALTGINIRNRECEARSASIPNLPHGEPDKESDDEAGDDLPTPPHVPLNAHGAGDQDVRHEHVGNISTWDRTTVLNYISQQGIKCNLKNPVQQLRKLVARHFFNTLLSKVPDTALQPLIERLKIRKQKNHARQKAQIRSAYLKTMDPTILQYLEDNRAQTEADVQPPSVPVYRNDFLPENVEDIMQKRREIMADREARIEGLNSGVFRLLNESGTNRIIEAGRDMHNELASYEMEDCKVCKERWFEMNVGVRSGKCQRCATERLDKNIPATFSPENDMHPGLPPTCLSILNSTEVAAISLICPQLTIYKLKGGATGMKGHSISFYQDVQGFVDRLPRRPEDLPIIVIKAPNQRVDLKANRFHLMNALDYLKKHNPEYKDIVIDEEALGCYPADSHTPIDNVQTLENTAAVSEPEPQPTDQVLDDNTGVLDNQDMVMTAAPFEMPTRPMAEQIRDRVLGEETRPESVDWPQRGGAASEWEYGYFSKAFPNLFPTGSGDLTKPRLGKSPKLLAYIKHLTRLPDTQFAQDPRFLLHVISMYRRHTALTLGEPSKKKMSQNSGKSPQFS